MPRVGVDALWRIAPKWLETQAVKATDKIAIEPMIEPAFQHLSFAYPLIAES